MVDEYSFRFTIKDQVESRKVMAELNSDKRVQALKDQYLSTGDSFCFFNVEPLVGWYLWAVNEFGEKFAKKNLNKFLDSDKVPLINTLWVLGIEVDKTLNLDNGLHIVPIENMPDSSDKEYYSNSNLRELMHIRKPKAAITHTCEIIKTFKVKSGEDVFKQLPENIELGKSSLLLHKTTYILNALSGISSSAYLLTPYFLPETPLIAYSVTSNSKNFYDANGIRFSKITEDNVSEINNLMNALANFSTKDEARGYRILSRLSQAKSGVQIEDKILDLGIALEMALLDESIKNDNLALSFSLRGSWLIGENKYHERQIIYKQLKNIYNYRSDVAHTGALRKNGAEKAREHFPEYLILAEKIINKVIYNNKIDWDELILGHA